MILRRHLRHQSQLIQKQHRRRSLLLENKNQSFQIRLDRYLKLILLKFLHRQIHQMHR
jgi:hypothetical protein